MKRYFTLFCLCIFMNILSSENLPWIKAYDGYELELVRQFIPNNPVILEAGAHKGEDTIIMKRKWPEATIYAFEPCPEYFSILQRTVSNLKNVHALPVALYNKKGVSNFYVSMKWDGASSLFEDVGNGLDYHDRKIEVSTVILDEWAQENNVPRIDYMWLDMEGAELYMLQSSPKILSTVKAISTEVNFKEFRKGFALFDELKLLLEESGFTLYKMWANEGQAGVGQATAFFVRLN